MRNDNVSSSKLFLSIFAMIALCGVGSLTYLPSASAAPALEAPSSFAAIAISETRIDLSWKHSGSGITGFIIERSLSASGGFSKIVSTGNSARSYSNTGLSSAQTYYYRVRTYKQKGGRVSYSLYTSVASATTLAPTPAPSAPPAPILNSVQVSGSGFILAWSQPSSTYGVPDGGYDIFIDGVDTNADHRTSGLSVTISGLPLGEHRFLVEARFTETSFAYPRSNELSAISPELAPSPSPSLSPSPSPSPEPSPTSGPVGYLPVFPGAQGFGTETKAGRGGKIIKVTNLNDSGTGSLRAALEASGPRIVVFEVSGTITLSNRLIIASPYITIAGQTAPSPGITIKGATIRVNAHDVLIQHLRIRVGDEPNNQSFDSDKDGIQIKGTNPHYNVVLDHISASWGIDENVGTWDGAHDITYSNSMFSEALEFSSETYSNGSKGILIGDNTNNISLVGNLMAHNAGRNPLIKGGSSAIVLNNLMYNGGKGLWMFINDDYNAGPALLSAVGNVFIDGPNTPSGSTAIHALSTCKSGTQVYYSENNLDNFAGALFKYDTAFNPFVKSAPIWLSSLTIRDSGSLESWVLSNAGSRPADRDAVDKRVVDEVRTRSGQIIRSQYEVGGWPTLAKNVRAFPVPINPNGDDDGDGYTNIEELLHQMAAQVEGR